MISGLPLFLHSRLATVDESPASDSKQAERIEGAPSVMMRPSRARRSGRLLASVREWMRWISPKPYVLEHARTPVQCVQMIS